MVIDDVPARVNYILVLYKHVDSILIKLKGKLQYPINYNKGYRLIDKHEIALIWCGQKVNKCGFQFYRTDVLTVFIYLSN